MLSYGLVNPCNKVKKRYRCCFFFLFFFFTVGGSKILADLYISMQVATILSAERY